MESDSIPCYTVYNNPSFAEYIADYFHKPLYKLKIMNGNDLLVDLPLVRIRKCMMALPFASAIGLNELPAHLPQDLCWPFLNSCMDIFKDGQSSEVQFADIMKSIRPEKERKAGINWHLRSFFPASPYISSNKCISYLPLKGTTNEIFGHFSSNLRRKIRKSVKNKIVVKSGGTGLADDFYKVYSANSTRLGSPVLEKDFYSGMAVAFGSSAASFFVAYHEGKAVGGALLLGYRKQWECIYFGTLGEYNHLYTSYLMIWEMICYAATADAELFSFGRSDAGTGVHQFKKQWGCFDIPLFWSNSHPVRFSIRQYKGMTRFWSYVPDVIRQKAGPSIARRIC